MTTDEATARPAPVLDQVTGDVRCWEVQAYGRCLREGIATRQDAEDFARTINQR